jgi:hypothetical protein
MRPVTAPGASQVNHGFDHGFDPPVMKFALKKGNTLNSEWARSLQRELELAILGEDGDGSDSGSTTVQRKDRRGSRNLLTRENAS